MIIVNYNGGDLIQAALDHLKRQTCKPHEVFVIDNASTDGSADRLDMAGLEHVRLVRMEENIGFAAANNRAAELATGDWLALLNPDTEPQPRWLEALLDASRRSS